jgi:hypothetical protein
MLSPHTKAGALPRSRSLREGRGFSLIIAAADHQIHVDRRKPPSRPQRLGHREEAEKFYRALAGQKVCVGMEASGRARWFERLLAELQIELWIGDAAEIRTRRVRKQKTNRQDAQLILKLMLKDDF